VVAVEARVAAVRGPVRNAHRFPSANTPA
jgi:hypothetical protein